MQQRHIYGLSHRTQAKNTGYIFGHNKKKMYLCRVKHHDSLKHKRQRIMTRRRNKRTYLLWMALGVISIITGLGSCRSRQYVEPVTYVSREPQPERPADISRVTTDTAEKQSTPSFIPEAPDYNDTTMKFFIKTFN